MLRLLRPMCPRAHTLQQGRPLRWEASALQLEISPHLPQQRKAVIATKTQWSQKYINNIKNRWTDRDMCTHTHTHTHTHTGIHWVIKKNEILAFAATWMELEGIMLSEISQTEKNKYCMISHLELKKGTTNRNITKGKQTCRYRK